MRIILKSGPACVGQVGIGTIHHKIPGVPELSPFQKMGLPRERAVM